MSEQRPKRRKPQRSRGKAAERRKTTDAAQALWRAILWTPPD